MPDRRSNHHNINDNDNINDNNNNAQPNPPASSRPPQPLPPVRCCDPKPPRHRRGFPPSPSGTPQTSIGPIDPLRDVDGIVRPFGNPRHLRRRPRGGSPAPPDLRVAPKSPHRRPPHRPWPPSRPRRFPTAPRRTSAASSTPPANSAASSDNKYE